MTAVHVTINWIAGGRPSVSRHSPDEAAQLQRDGCRVHKVEERLLDAWQRHLDDCMAWRALWGEMDERSIVERKLLEDATIRRACATGKIRLEDAIVALGLVAPRADDSPEAARRRCLASGA